MSKASEANTLVHGADAQLDVIERPDPMALADFILDNYERDSCERALLLRWRGDYFRWDRGAWRAVSDEALDADIRNRLAKSWTTKRDKYGAEVKGEDGKPKLRPIVPNAALVREVRLALPSRGILVDDTLDAPAWLPAETFKQYDPRELLVFPNGILDIARDELHPPNPYLFTLNATTFNYNKRPPTPERWLAFLKQLWPDDAEARRTLRQWFGYCLTADTRLQKMLMLVGPKRSGKGTVARILTALLGQVNVAGPTLGSLASNFGTQALLGKLLAIIADARLSGRTDQAIVVERLLTISGEDSITVDRKHRDPLTVTLPTRLMLLTNELPRLADSSGALAGRFLVLTLRESFYGNEDPRLTDKLLAELPGIMQWACDGWRDLAVRGRFFEPESSREAIGELEDLASPVGAFIRERCVVEPGMETECATLYAAWKAWCDEQGRDRPGTVASFGRDLRAAVPGIRISRPRVDGHRTRVYECIGLEPNY